MKVPFLDLKAQNRSIWFELLSALEDVMSEAQFILGPAVERFEARFAEYVGVRHCVGLNNGTSALHMALIACDVGPGDEVITTPHTWISTSWAISYVGARPVFVDIDPATYTLDPDLVERAITPRTRVIAITHLTSTTGIRYPVKPIAELARRRDIFLHVDGAQTFGACAVNLRDLGCDSYSASAHKWPMGPLEAGVLFVRSERVGQIWPSIVSAGWSDGLKGARKFEAVGQQDDPRVAALEAAVDLLELIGLREVEARVQALAGRAKRALAELANVEL